jgi:tRNA-dihydrouridine synthase
VENALAIEKAGASAVAVHARTRSQFYSGKADWEKLAVIKKEVKIPVIANGDIASVDDLKKVEEISGCDGYMIGRGALGEPYIFSKLLGNDYIFEAKKAILQHIQDLQKVFPDRVVANNMKKHICYYAKGLQNKKQLKTEVNSSIDLAQIISVVERYFLGEVL